MNKKAEWKVEPGIVWFILFIILIIATMWIGSWECKNDNDCESGEICTVKHTCYSPENTQTTIIKTENKYILASFIIGLSIIAAAIIIKTKEFKLSHHAHKLRRK